MHGPVERIDESLVLRIPLAAGGAKLRRAAMGISYVDETHLNVIIPDWLAAKLPVIDGDTVVVDNRDGRLNITLQPKKENWPEG